MPDDTTILSLPLILPAQAQKHVTHNEALAILDVLVQLSVLDADRTEPPALPSPGDRHIVAAGAIGPWAGQVGRIAVHDGLGWQFTVPLPGFLAYDRGTGAILAFDGVDWLPAGGGGGPVAMLGVNTAADATNRLAVAAPATLLTHDGAGHQLKVNKAAAGDTASLLFQTGFSGRAEMGTMGADSFGIKVSADGAAFVTALAVDPASGVVSMPEGVSTAAFLMRDGTDPMKRAVFDLSGLPAGALRSYTLPNSNTELASLGGTQTFNGAKTFSGTVTVSAATGTFGSSTANATYGLGTGATAAGNSKTVSVGTGGAAGSVTGVVIGPATMGATGTTTIQGTTLTLGPTVAEADLGGASVRGALLGVGGATADATNRLSVVSSGVLLNHAGAGIETALNKATAGETAALSLKTGFSTRARIGLLGNDDLSVQVSADGAVFASALTAEAGTGRVTMAQPVILSGQAADPLAPPDGALWHNAATGQIKARLGGVDVALDGGAVPPFLTPVSGDLVLTTCGAGGGATTTLAGAANRMDLFPFAPRAEVAVDRVLINCTTAVAAALAKVVVYAADPQGRPAALLAETADMDLSATGAKFAPLALTLLQGRCYWLGLRHSSTATVSVWPLAATPDINGGAAVVTTARKVLRRTLAYGTQAPAVWGFAASEINAAAATAIWLRMV